MQEYYYRGMYHAYDPGDKEIDIERVTKDITKIIHQIGIPAHISGYLYVRLAILLSLEEETGKMSITKTLYPEIARAYGTTPARVERGIRHAIEKAWACGNIEIIEEIFGFSTSASMGRPTNSEFIATIADYIRMEFRL